MNMESPQLATAALEAAAPLSDGEVAERVVRGERALFEILMRRHNQRIYRVVRSVLRDERDVEDVMQQAYVNAFVHLHQFERRSQFSTWLTRIALNEAFARRKKGEAGAGDGAAHDQQSGELMNSIPSPAPDPERQAYAGELTRALEQAVDALPEMYRTVFMLRDVEGRARARPARASGLATKPSRRGCTARGRWSGARSPRGWANRCRRRFSSWRRGATGSSRRCSRRSARCSAWSATALAERLRVLTEGDQNSLLPSSVRSPPTRTSFAPAAVDSLLSRFGFAPPLTFLSSSMADHPAVNRRVVGSNPT